MNFAIFGDSYIKRLEKYTNGNMHFKHKCNFYGVSGMSTTKKFKPMYDRLKTDKPRYVFINLGGNNIDRTCSPAEIYTDIINIVEDLKSSGVERVFVSSIVERGQFPHWTRITKYEFNMIRRSVNERLKKYLKEDYVDMGKKLRFPRHYDQDLVHPGDQEGGMKILRSTIHRCFSKTITS